MSKLRDARHRHDVFFKKAREEGFAARSVFKLEEIDKRVRLLRAGARVLDLGCRPGSWLQYAVKIVGKHGVVVGIDRDPLPAPIPGARVILGDIYKITDGELLGEAAAFDAVLSDMAPDTTGIRATDQARSAALFEEALGRAERLLAPGGAFVGKIFQGPDLPTIRRRMAARFAEVRIVKPESSRAQSIEIYLAGTGFTPPPA
ncbi:MAG: rRNA (uridine2552-2-O)-methyltransferase [Myxococcales bacterium]|jgi:23S rRNA (uridine2552-2'-O)-methyltransferase|nr:rRNA (uridine2552-2-O)-methyltransferase [Myxococcales bacterium]